MDPAQAVVARLSLVPHPEGGWYRETWRGGPADAAGRAAASAILFLLEEGRRSHWHRIDATELWLFQAGAPLLLDSAAAGEAAIVSTLLGSDIVAGHSAQYVVTPGAWQRARTTHGWSLVACVVSPAFDFARFELAPPGWRPGDASPA